MATTAIWPVKGSLEKLLTYAENPNKTINSDYCDDDLFQVLSYAKDEVKTDKEFFVTGINCIDKLAYEQMMNTKRRYGKTGGNVAYHGFQSFKTGEVTPELCHKIGIETARRLWGDRYEVIITTHLNTDNCHNHFVVNSVSFTDGKKFNCQKHTHLDIRRISDDICMEKGLSVIEKPKRNTPPRTAYLAQKSGKETHFSMLKRDVDRAISLSGSDAEFMNHMRSMGYRFTRTEQYKHPAVIADGWKRPIRLDRLGDGYTYDSISDKIDENLQVKGMYFYSPARKPTQKPLSDLEYELKMLEHMDDIEALFWIICELLKMVFIGNLEQQNPNQPISPFLRQEIIKLDKYNKELWLLSSNDIHSEEKLSSFIAKTSGAISELEAARYEIDKRIRRPQSNEDLEYQKEKRRQLSAQLKPLRAELRTAKEIQNDLPGVRRLIEIERQAESLDRNKMKERNR